MSKQIPQETIERIRLESDLVDTVSQYVNLQKVGKRYRGLCPFHNEKTPSFYISPEEQLFHCFGCGAGGNIFHFLMEIEQLNFVEVCKKLAEASGIELPRDEDQKNSAVLEEKAQIKRINKLAANFFNTVLLKTDRGRKARLYLQKRGITRKTIEVFHLGYAPDNWQGVRDFLLKKGFSDEEILKSGLCNQKESTGRVYDRFRDRVMYPIYNQRGDILGFGGRLLQEQGQQPKYLNSPETLIFNKRKNLYGIHLAFKNIRKQERALVVEGYMDVIAAYQLGLPVAVASLGTALTEDQARLIKYNTDKVYIAYDADTAGEAATLRGLEILNQIGLDVRVCSLPESYDPDDYLREFGLESFEKNIVEKALPLTEYWIRQAAQNKNLNTIEGKKEYVEEVIPIIVKIDHAVLREEYLKRVAHEIDVSVESLKTELSKYYKSQRGKTNSKQRMDKTGVIRNNNGKKLNVASTSKQKNTNESEKNPNYKAEEQLICLMVRFPGYIDLVQQHLYPEDFMDKDFQLIVHQLYRMNRDYEEEISIAKLVTKLDEVKPGSGKVISKLTFEAFPEPKNVNKFVTDCAYRIKEQQLKVKKQECLRQLGELDPVQEPDKYREVLSKLQGYIKMEKSKETVLDGRG